MAADLAYPFIGLAFFVGLMCGFGLWELIERTKWAAYRAVYRHTEPKEPTDGR